MAEPSASKMAQSRFAWVLYDWANSAFATVVLTALFPVWFAALLPAEGVHLPGLKSPLQATSLWGYLVSLSLLLIALTAPQAGRWADRTGRQRLCFRACVAVGVIGSLLLAWPQPHQWGQAALAFLLANLGFAAGNLFYNSYLPHLADDSDLDRLSSRGFALGYLGGGLALLLVFGLISSSDHLGMSKADATRIGLALAGLWWLVFSLPAMRRLPRLQPTLLPKVSYFAVFRDLMQHRQLLRFLLAFLLYNDGVQTIIVISGIFAREELGLATSDILACFLLIQFISLPATLVCGRLAVRFGCKPVLLVAISVFVGISLWACFMRHVWEFWALGVAVALVLGGIQALSRSLFSRLVPVEKSTEFFGFFAVGNKFAAIAGPFAFALISQLTGSTRLAVASVGIVLLTGGILLTTVDTRGEGAD